jgi:predicted ribonuclease YlaK
MSAHALRTGPVRAPVESKFRPEAVAAHVELQKGERSELVELAANIL